jgi:hypothetical protein
MQRPHSALALTGATALAVLVGLGIPAAAGAASGPTTGHAVPGGTPVYVQTNDPTGNQIITYAPDANGSLVEVGHHSTGGDGYGLQGAAADQLASQGSLVYDRANGDLVAVNAGSNTIAVFTTVGGRIDGRTVLPSGGTIPVSVTVHGNDLFVLNAGGAGSVQGYFLSTLTPIPGSARSLGLTPGLTPQFLNTPGQIGFTPSGTQLVVTTKLNGSDIDVFNVTSGGALSAPVVNAAANPVPFGFVFDAAGQLVVTEAGASALTTYDIAADGTTTEVSSTTDGLKALCWVTSAGHRFVYGANAGSNDVTDRPGRHAQRVGALRRDRWERPRRLLPGAAERQPGLDRLGRSRAAGPRRPGGHRRRLRRMDRGAGAG